MTLAAIEIYPETPVQGSVIWLHGLGASGHDFADVIPQLQLPKELSLRFIFPHAPTRPVTINDGFTMPAWYDILGFDQAAREDEVGLMASEEEIRELIAHEIQRGVKAESIILAGFSQGGATALFTGLRYHLTLKGILVLSAYCPLQETLADSREKANQNTPIWVGHGTQDEIVPFEWAQATHEILKLWKYPVSLKQYPIPHTVNLDEIQDIGRWITSLYLK